eukprot:SAG22_NODE_4528_length_1242_cov_1.227273_2_plen_191_part_00
MILRSGGSCGRTRTDDPSASAAARTVRAASVTMAARGELLLPPQFFLAPLALLLVLDQSSATPSSPPCPDSRRLHNNICLAPVWPPRRNISRRPPPPPYIVDPPGAIDISVGRQLFVDSGFLAHSMDNLPQTFHEPEWHPANPVLRPTASWETNAGPYGGGIWHDETDGLIKVWYGCGGGAFGSYNLCKC